MYRAQSTEFRLIYSVNQRKSELDHTILSALCTLYSELCTLAFILFPKQKTLQLFLDNKKPPAPSSGTEGFRVATQLAQTVRLRRSSALYGALPGDSSSPAPGWIAIPSNCLAPPGSSLTGSVLAIPLHCGNQYHSTKEQQLQVKNDLKEQENCVIL